MAEKISDQRQIARDENLHSLFEMIRANHQTFTEFQQSMNCLATTVSNHMAQEEVHYRETTEELKKLNNSMKNVSVLFDAFPKTANGEIDVEGHHNYHHSLIKDSEKSEKFWAEMKKDIASTLAKGIIFATLVILGLGLKDFASFYFKPQPKEIQQTAPSILK